jgi:hypothetical protein
MPTFITTAATVNGLFTGVIDHLERKKGLGGD